jgi:hypothetical protein
LLSCSKLFVTFFAMGLNDMKAKLFSGFFIVIAVLISANASAVPVTMTLESLSADQDRPYIENGFFVEAPGEHLHATFNNQFTLPGAFTNAAQMAADTTGTRLAQVGGGLFNLISLEAVNVLGSDALPGGTGFAVQIDGLLNGVVQTSMQLSSGTVAVLDFVGAGGWTGLDEVQFWYQSQGAFGNISSFTGDDFKFDNIVIEASVSQVPVPAAAWLFISAIGGLGVMRRKQAVA